MGSFFPLFNLFSTILFSRPILFLTSVIQNHLINFRTNAISLQALRSEKFYLLKDYELEEGSKMVPFILKKWRELESGHHEQVPESAKEISEMVAFPRVERIEE